MLKRIVNYLFLWLREVKRWFLRIIISEEVEDAIIVKWRKEFGKLRVETVEKVKDWVIVYRGMEIPVGLFLDDKVDVLLRQIDDKVTDIIKEGFERIRG